MNTILNLPPVRQKRAMDRFQVGDQVTFEWIGITRVGWVASRYIFHGWPRGGVLSLIEVHCHDDQDLGWFAPQDLRGTKRGGLPWVNDGPHSSRVRLGKQYYATMGESDPWWCLTVVPFAICKRGYLCRVCLDDHPEVRMTKRQRERVRTLTAEDLS